MRLPERMGVDLGLIVGDPEAREARHRSGLHGFYHRLMGGILDEAAAVLVAMKAVRVRIRLIERQPLRYAAHVVSPDMAEAVHLGLDVAEEGVVLVARVAGGVE